MFWTWNGSVTFRSISEKYYIKISSRAQNSYIDGSTKWGTLSVAFKVPSRMLTLTAAPKINEPQRQPLKLLKEWKKEKPCHRFFEGKWTTLQKDSFVVSKDKIKLQRNLMRYQKICVLKKLIKPILKYINTILDLK